MQLERIDALDELLKILDRSGLCRADRCVSAERGPHSMAIQISTKIERLQDTHSGPHRYDIKVLAPVQ